MARLAILVAISLFVCSAALAEITIESKQGQQITVEVLSVGPKEAMVVMNTRRMKVLLDQLTDDSKARLIEYAKSKEAVVPFPRLKVEVQVARKRRLAPNSSYKKVLTISPSIAVTGVSKLEPIPAAEATMVIIGMDTREKYARGKEKFVVQLNETKPVPAAENGNRRGFSFEELSSTYDADFDDTNLGGIVYKFYVFALRDPASKHIIDFQTTDPQLQAFVARFPEKRNEILGLQKGAAYPAKFE
jgi:hypothetical protein